MYTTAFEQAVDHAMIYEVGGMWNLATPGTVDGTNLKACGYTNDPVDRGGETKYGISKRAHPTVDIRALTWAQAQRIYYDAYWIKGQCMMLSGPVGIMHFDTCVNMGVGAASKILQKALGVSVDGVVGPRTINAAKSMDFAVICSAIADQRVDYYKQIVKKSPSQAKYIKGWLRRVNELRAFTINTGKV